MHTAEIVDSDEDANSISKLPVNHDKDPLDSNSNEEARTLGTINDRVTVRDPEKGEEGRRAHKKPKRDLRRKSRGGEKQEGR